MMKNFLVIAIVLLLGSNAFLLYKNYIEKSPVVSVVSPVDKPLVDESVATSNDETEGVVEDIPEVEVNITAQSTSSPSSKIVAPKAATIASTKSKTVTKVDDRYQPFTIGSSRVPNSPYISVVKEANKTIVLGDPLTIKWVASSTIKEIYIDFFSTENITARAPNDIQGIFAKSGSATFTLDDQTPTGTFAFRICKAVSEGEAHCQNAPHKITVVRPSISFIYPDENISIGKNVTLGIRWKAVLPQKYKNNPLDVYLVRYTGQTAPASAESASPLETKYMLATNIPNTGSYGFDIAKAYGELKNIFGTSGGIVKVVARVCVKDISVEGVSRYITCTGMVDGWEHPGNYIEIKE